MFIALVGLVFILGSGYYLVDDIMAFAQGYPTETLLAASLQAAHQMGMAVPVWQALGVWLSPLLTGVALFVYGMNSDARRMRH